MHLRQINIPIRVDHFRLATWLGSMMKCSVVGICKLCRYIPGNHPIIVDPPVWNSPVSGIDYPHSTFWETEDGGTDILNAVISYSLVKNILLARINGDRIPH